MSWVTLKSSDGELFQIEEQVAKRCGLLNQMMNILGSEETECIPLSAISAETLLKVIEWLKQYNTSAGEESVENTKLSPWDETFFKVDNQLLMDIIQAADFLDIPRLCIMASMNIANMIRNKSAKEMQEILRLPHRQRWPATPTGVTTSAVSTRSGRAIVKPSRYFKTD